MPEWRLTADEARLVQLLLWLDERDVGENTTMVAPFYDDDQARMQQSRADLRDLEARLGTSLLHRGDESGWDASDAAARRPQRGRDAASEPGEPAGPADGLPLGVGEVDAIELPSSALDWFLITKTEHSAFYGDAFTELDLERAAAWLYRHSLVGGPTVAESDAPALVYLTDQGVVCAERYDCDTSRFLEAEKMQQQRGATFNVAGQNVQVATGDHSQQVINLGPTAQELATALQGLAEIVQGLGLADGADLDELTAEAVEDITSDRPTGKPAGRLLAKVRGLASTGASQAVSTAVALAVTAAQDDVAALVGVLGG